jgi:hypothetical protein
VARAVAEAGDATQAETIAGAIADPASGVAQALAETGDADLSREVIQSLLSIAAISLAGQVLSRPSSRVHSPVSSTGAVALRSQTALTGSDWPRIILAAGAGTTHLHG